MNGKKKCICFILFVVLLLAFIIGGVLFLRWSADKKKTESTAELQLEDDKKAEKEADPNKEQSIEERNVEFVDFELLEGIFLSSQIEELQEEILQFLERDPAYDSITKVVCKDTVTEQLKTIEFYCVLDEETGSVLYIVYKKSSGQFEISSETISTEVLNQTRQENVQQFVETKPTENDPKDEAQLPSQWNYVEEDDTQVTISNKECLEEKIPQEKLEKLESELLAYLKEQQEFRREIEILKDSIQESDTEISFWGMFRTPRVDGQDLYITYEKAKEHFQFSIQEEK